MDPQTVRMHFCRERYEEYQNSASQYAQRQSRLYRDGMYVLTLRNHRRIMENNNFDVTRTIATFLDVDLDAHPNAIKNAKAVPNTKNSKDCTVVFLFKMTDPEQANRIMISRARLLQQMGSFNVQLAREDKEAVRKLKLLKQNGIIAGYGQNRHGISYVSLWKPVQKKSSYFGSSSSHINTPEREYVLLNAPAIDCELSSTECFRLLKRPRESIYMHRMSSRSVKAIDVMTIHGKPGDIFLKNLQLSLHLSNKYQIIVERSMYRQARNRQDSRRNDNRQQRPSSKHRVPPPLQQGQHDVDRYDHERHSKPGSRPHYEYPCKEPRYYDSYPPNAVYPNRQGTWIPATETPNYSIRQPKYPLSSGNAVVSPPSYMIPVQHCMPPPVLTSYYPTQMPAPRYAPYTSPYPTRHPGTTETNRDVDYTVDNQLTSSFAGLCFTKNYN